MKIRVLSIIIIAIIMTSCGTQKQVVKEDAIKNDVVKKVVVPPPTGVLVMDTATKVFASVNLPKNDNWVIKNEDATWRHDEFLVNKMDDYRKLATIRTMSLGKFSADIHDTIEAVSILKINIGVMLCYNDFHFKKDGDGNPIETPVYTSKLITLNNHKVLFVEAEIKITNKEYTTFGNSYYARNYYFLAEKDENNKIPIISSATLLKPENYEAEKVKFIELVDYVVNTAVVNPEFKF